MPSERDPGGLSDTEQVDRQDLSTEGWVELSESLLRQLASFH